MSIQWNLSQQKGFKYCSSNGVFSSFGGTRREKVALHEQNEDFYFPLRSDDSASSDSDDSISDDDDGDLMNLDTPSTATKPRSKTARLSSKNTSIHGDEIFLMADGHAGHEAPRFFISGITTAVLDLLNEKKWDFSNSDENIDLQQRICLIYSQLDDEYTRIKTKEYQDWNRAGADPSRKPCDDGCTMILNIIQQGWLLNCNVGDSRTVVARRRKIALPTPTTSSSIDKEEDDDNDDDTFSNDDDLDRQDQEQEQNQDGEDTLLSFYSSPPNSSTKSKNRPLFYTPPKEDPHHPIKRLKPLLAHQRASFGRNENSWKIIFASIDHNMTNPHKVYSIYQNGGKFLDPTGSTFLHPKVEHPFHRMSKGGYPELSSSRLFRPPSDVVKNVGCSHRRTLNLSGTLGDLLFKIEPAVLESTPDFSFIKLEREREDEDGDGGYEYFVVVATDGVWDHLCVSDFMRQNEMVMEKVCELVECHSLSTNSEQKDGNEVDLNGDMGMKGISDDDDDVQSDSSQVSQTTYSSAEDTSLSPEKVQEQLQAAKTSPPSSKPVYSSELLRKVCGIMVEREPPADCVYGMDLMYSKNLIRYDDATMMIIHLAP